VGETCGTDWLEWTHHDFNVVMIRRDPQYHRPTLSVLKDGLKIAVELRQYGEDVGKAQDFAVAQWWRTKMEQEAEEEL
jgi:hypothetical protein